MQNIEIKALNEIVTNTIAAVELGKTQIYDIYEAARNEVENVKKDVERIKQETIDIIFKVDELERQPNIKSGDLYLIHEYNENANKVKLTNAIKSMVFTDQVRSNMDATLELFMRETDNNTRSVAREFISNIYDDGQ